MSKAKKVLVALSGGVDSAVAALLLQQQGYELAAVHLRFWSEDSTDKMRQNICCSEESAGHAKRICDRLGIPLQVWDYSSAFYEAVVSDYLAACEAGRTPNPCVVCNQRIKFGLFIEQALSLGFDLVASGHWARVSREGGSFILSRAANRHKDQSYFLYRLGQQQLQYILFPLAELGSKAEVRELARRHQLEVSESPDSQEICFISDGDRAGFLARQQPDLLRPGLVYSMAGELLGEHEGLALYTEGQRRGIRVAGGQRLYVVEKRLSDNSLILGNMVESEQSTFLVTREHWIGGVCPELPCDCDCRIRYQGALLECRISSRQGGDLVVRSARPVSGIAPGQSAVFYAEDKVLGGGEIRLA